MIETASSKITEFTIDRKLYELWPETIFDLMAWCRDYNRYNKFPATVLNRFAIGFYQIHQGISWKDNGKNKFESFAASVLHLCMIAETMNLAIEDYLMLNLDNFGRPSVIETSLDLLTNLSATQQQLFYGNPENKTKRKSRYNEVLLTKYLSTSIDILISWIPVAYRKECFNLASKIMIKELK